MLKSTDTPSFIPAGEAAARLRVSLDTIRKHCRAGTYPAEQRRTPRGMAWFVDTSALPAQPVPDVFQNIAEDASAATQVSVATIEALTAHIDDLRGQLATQSTAHADAIAQLREAHTAEIARLVDVQSEQIARLVYAHAREVATLRDVNRDQYVILERLSVPRLADSQSAAPRPWWRVW
jgi:hypothetical protein